MQRNPDPRGVCIVRVTRQGAGLFVTVISRLDVSETAGQSELNRVGVDEGMAAVRKFLEEFARAHAIG
jgi:hypothetical protein